MFKEFTFKRFDGNNIKIGGYRFSEKKLAGKSTFKSSRAGSLPRQVDLRNHMTDIESQGGLNSCVANAVAGAYEYLAKRHEDLEYDVSRLFIYYNGRSLGDMEDEDEGCYIRDAIESLKEYGACSEETYPYDEDNVNEEPDEEAYEEAKGFLVESVEVVPTELDAWKSCLAEGHPIIFGLLLFKSFDKQRKKGLVPMPSKKESSRGNHSGHAMLCVGYSDTDQVFIVRNSWGEGWGDGGYCYIPYRYILNPDLNFGDSWIIKQLDNFDDYQEDWSDEEESILSDLKTELANMPRKRYRKMVQAMAPYPLPVRVSLILLAASGSDGEISSEEYEEIADYIDNVLAEMGYSNLNSLQLLRNCGNLYKRQKLIAKTVELMGQFLSKQVLARILLDAEKLASVDDLDDSESDFIDMLIQAWQIQDHLEEEEGDYGEEGDQEYDYEEYDYEEEEEDYDEEDEGYYYEEEEYEDEEYEDSDEEYEDEEYEDSDEEYEDEEYEDEEYEDSDEEYEDEEYEDGENEDSDEGYEDEEYEDE